MEVIIECGIGKDSYIINEALYVWEVSKKRVHDQLKEVGAVVDAHRKSLVFKESKWGADHTKFLVLPRDNEGEEGPMASLNLF